MGPLTRAVTGDPPRAGTSTGPPPVHRSAGWAEYSEAGACYLWSCRCGDRFEVLESQLESDVDTFECISCALKIRVLFELADEDAALVANRFRLDMLVARSFAENSANVHAAFVGEGTVADVAEKLGLQPASVSVRATTLRKALRDHDVELPKMRRRARGAKKDFPKLAEIIRQKQQAMEAIAAADEADAEA